MGVLLLSLGGTALAQTGALTVQWNASADPSVESYRVYFGLTSGTVTNLVQVAADTQTCPSTCSIQLTGLQPVTTYFVQVAAVTGLGCESPRSALLSALSSNPGPVCTGLAPSSLAQGAQNQPVTIQGIGFESGPSIAFSQFPYDTLPLNIRSAQQIGTTEIRLNVDVSRFTPTGPATVTIRNQDPTQPPTTCPGAIDITQSDARADVNSSGRVDGFDVTILSIAFGAFNRVCSVDAPTRKGLPCDSETDCGGVVASTSFCTHNQCVPTAPSNAGAACRSSASCGGAACSPSPYNQLADLNSDGIVDGVDLSLITARIGRHP